MESGEIHFPTSDAPSALPSESPSVLELRVEAELVAWGLVAELVAACISIGEYQVLAELTPQTFRWSKGS